MCKLNFYLSGAASAASVSRGFQQRADEACDWNLQAMRVLLAEWGVSDVGSLSYAEAMRQLAAAVADAREGCYLMFDK